MKRIITFVVTAFYAATASANPLDDIVTDIVKERSGFNSLAEWFNQLVLWPEPLGGAIAFAMIFYGLTRFKKKLTWIEYIGAFFVGWVAGISLTWFDLVGWGWATLFIPIAINWKWLIRFVAKLLKIKFLETLAERLQAGDSSKIKGFEECPSCHKPSLGINVCSAGCGYRRPNANPTPATTTAREAAMPSASIPKNLSEAVDLAGDDI